IHYYKKNSFINWRYVLSFKLLFLLYPAKLNPLKPLTNHSWTRQEYKICYTLFSQYFLTRPSYPMQFPNSTTVKQDNSTTVIRDNGPTVTRDNSTTIVRDNSTTITRNNRYTVVQDNGITVVED